MHECPYCECEDEVEVTPRDLVANPLTPMEQMMIEVYNQAVIDQLESAVTFRRLTGGER